MNKHFSKVKEILKPKFAPFGFSDDDLKGVVESIADNFKEDEELDEAKVNALGDAVVPALKASQSNANRVINAKIEEYKKQNPQPTPSPKEETEEQPKGEEQMPAWAKALQQQNQELLQQIGTLQAEKSNGVRRSKYEQALAKIKESMPKQYEKMMKDFDRFQFKDDKDFDEFLATETETVNGLVQELTDKGLISTPPQGGKGDDEKDLLLEQINAGTKEIQDAKNK